MIGQKFSRKENHGLQVLKICLASKCLNHHPIILEQDGNKKAR